MSSRDCEAPLAALQTLLLRWIPKVSEHLTKHCIILRGHHLAGLDLSGLRCLAAYGERRGSPANSVPTAIHGGIETSRILFPGSRGAHRVGVHSLERSVGLSRSPQAALILHEGLGPPTSSCAGYQRGVRSVSDFPALTVKKWSEWLRPRCLTSRPLKWGELGLVSLWYGHLQSWEKDLPPD